MFIIRNNILIYLSRMKSCLWAVWGWSCYHYSLAQRSITHRIHIFLATLSMMQLPHLQTQLILIKISSLGIGGVSIWCASGHGFLLRTSATYRSLMLVLSLGAQITRTGTYPRTHTGSRAHVLFIAMALKQTQM